jgi:septal ring factor EnvC (AmiA/AmiB activator)
MSLELIARQTGFPIFLTKVRKMSFDLSQQQELEKLKEELSRLNNQFDVQLRGMGMSEEDLKDLEFDDISPELKTRLEAAQAAAKRAGEERARRTRAEQNAYAARSSGHRPGALWL